MLGSLQDLDASRLQEICDDQRPETQTLDFKRELPTNNDKGKHDFLKDVCAFANSDGGDIVFGIVDVDGKAQSIAPITAEPLDKIKRRLGEMMASGLQPRLNGTQFHEVPVDSGYVLILRVPSSFDGPHRYMFDTHYRFVMRNDTHTADLSYDQLRAAFDRGATLGERARRFRQDRLDLLIAGRTPKQIIAGPVWVVHIIPLAAMTGRKSIDVRALHRDCSRFTMANWHGGSRTLNLDGLVVHPSVFQEESLDAYTQVFRSGTIETLSHGGWYTDPEKKSIPATEVSGCIREAIFKLVDASRSLGFSGPAIVGVALLEVKDHTLETGRSFVRSAPTRFTESNMVIPETWIESIDALSDVDEVVRPVLDILWQAFNYERCLEYSTEGAWEPRRN